MTALIDYDLAGRIATLSLNRPEALSAARCAAQAGPEEELWALTELPWAKVQALDDATEGPKDLAETRQPIWTGA